MSVFDVLEVRDDQTPLSFARLYCLVVKGSKAYVLVLVVERKVPVEPTTLIDTMCAERLSNTVAYDKQERRGVMAEHIPQELVAYSQRVCWRYVDRGQGRKPDKQPVNPRMLSNADVHWANT